MSEKNHFAELPKIAQKHICISFYKLKHDEIQKNYEEIKSMSEDHPNRNKCPYIKCGYLTQSNSMVQRFYEEKQPNSEYVVKLEYDIIGEYYYNKEVNESLNK